VLDFYLFMALALSMRNVGHFAYKTFRLLGTSPTTWTLRLLDISPTGQFAYETFRLLDTSPTMWTVRRLNVNTREWKCVTYTVFQKQELSSSWDGRPWPQWTRA